MYEGKVWTENIRSKYLYYTIRYSDCSGHLNSRCESTARRLRVWFRPCPSVWRRIRHGPSVTTQLTANGIQISDCSNPTVLRPYCTVYHLIISVILKPSKQNFSLIVVIDHGKWWLFSDDEKSEEKAKMNLIILITIFSVFSFARKGKSDFLVDAHKMVPATNDTMSQSVTMWPIFKMFRVEASSQGRRTLGVMGDWTWRKDSKNVQDEDWTDWTDFWSQS